MHSETIPIYLFLSRKIQEIQEDKKESLNGKVHIIEKYRYISFVATLPWVRLNSFLMIKP